MSMENAKAFYEKVMQDKDLFNKIGQIQQNDPKGLETGIVKLATENKFEFTVAEMKAFLEEQAKKFRAGGELSDEQLEAVAGGASKTDNWVGNSLGTFGFNCAISGIAQAAGGYCGNGMD